jgi:glycosyltransferase involved in cell wall biosynthesis
MGLDVLVEAFSLVAREFEHSLLLIAGDGPIRQQLERQASQLDQGGRIVFLGKVPEEKLPLLYRATDLFVVPTLELEGLGLVTLEALASGIPVVGTDVGGTREILEQVEPKCIIKNLEPRLLAQGMMDILRLTEGERLALGKRGRELVETAFAWDSIVRNVENHLVETSDRD